MPTSAWGCLDYRLPDGLTILLGPNGAGKSTLLKLVASVIRPASGAVTYEGLRFGSREYRQAVARPAWTPANGGSSATSWRPCVVTCGC